MARIAEAVVGIEDDADMVREGETILADLGADNVVLLERPLAQGAQKHGPYDVITLQGAVEVIPETILAQLKDGGRIAALFAEGELGLVKIGHKRNGVVTWRRVCNAGAPVLPGFKKTAQFSL